MIDTKMVFIVDVYVKTPVIKKNILFKRTVFPAIKMGPYAAAIVMSVLEESVLEDVRKNSKLSGVTFYAKSSPGFFVPKEEYITGAKTASIILDYVNNYNEDKFKFLDDPREKLIKEAIELLEQEREVSHGQA